MEDDEDDEEESEDDEDMDHDEIILGNSTDVLISVAKALGNDFLKYFTTIAPKLVKYLEDERPKSDKIMIIGCFAEIMAACPSAIDAYFDHFYKVLTQHSNTTDGQMIRNVSYGFGILCKNQPTKFKAVLQDTLQVVQSMHGLCDAQDAKDNCIACIIRILDQFGSEFPENVYNDMYNRVMSQIPFEADPTENETVIKFCMN